MAKELCDICDEPAKHFPVADWKGTAEQYCCYCYTGSNNCDYCEETINVG